MLVEIITFYSSKQAHCASLCSCILLWSGSYNMLHARTVSFSMYGISHEMEMVLHRLFLFALWSITAQNGHSNGIWPTGYLLHFVLCVEKYFNNASYIGFRRFLCRERKKKKLYLILFKLMESLYRMCILKHFFVSQKSNKAVFATHRVHNTNSIPYDATRWQWLFFSNVMSRNVCSVVVIHLSFYISSKSTYDYYWRKYKEKLLRKFWNWKAFKFIT